jgi:hypothetical protein
MLRMAVAVLLLTVSAPAAAGSGQLVDSPCKAFSFSADGKLLAVASESGISLFDMAAGKRLWHRQAVEEKPLADCTAARFGPADKVLFLRCGEEEVRALESATGKDQAIGGLPPVFDNDSPPLPEGLVPGGTRLAAGVAETGVEAALVEDEGKQGKERWQIRFRRDRQDGDGTAHVVCKPCGKPRMGLRPGSDQLVYTCATGLAFWSLDKKWDIGLLSVSPGGGWWIRARNGYLTGDLAGLKTLCERNDDPEFVLDSKVEFPKVAEWMGFPKARRDVEGVAHESVWRRGETKLCSHLLEGVPARAEIEKELVGLVKEAGGYLEISQRGFVKYGLTGNPRLVETAWLSDLEEVDGDASLVTLMCRMSVDRKGVEEILDCVEAHGSSRLPVMALKTPEGKGSRATQLFKWLLLRCPEYGPRPRGAW